MKDRLIDLCHSLCMAFACAAALCYLGQGPEVQIWLHVMLWFSLALAAVFALLLVLMAGVRILEALVKLTVSPKERHYWEAREAGEKRFREMFGKATSPSPPAPATEPYQRPE